MSISKSENSGFLTSFGFKGKWVDGATNLDKLEEDACHGPCCHGLCPVLARGNPC